MGLDPRIGLKRSYKNAMCRRTAFVDGQIAAMWGLCGTLMGDIGYPYLMTSAAVERVPIRMVKEARNGIAEMLAIKRRLSGHVAASYTQACNFLELLGFTLGQPQPMGPHSMPFRTFDLSR